MDPEDFGRVQELRRIIADIRASDINFLWRTARDLRDGQRLRRELKRLARLLQTDARQTLLGGRFKNALHADGGARRFRGHEHGAAIMGGRSHSPKGCNFAISVTLPSRNIEELNNVAVILLDVFSDQADMGKLASMKEAEVLFDNQLKLLNRSVLKAWRQH